jgi:hypothetical protein
MDNKTGILENRFQKGIDRIKIHEKQINNIQVVSFDSCEFVFSAQEMIYAYRSDKTSTRHKGTIP